MKKLFIILLLIFSNNIVTAQCTKLFDFSGTADGQNPAGDLFYDGTSLFGMTADGGANGKGTIFKIDPNGTGYVKLLDFAGATNGQRPYGSLISDGTFLYGMTFYGGINGSGVIFKIMPNGSGYVKLLDFPSSTNPSGSLFYDGTFLYGMTGQGGINSDGIIFKIKPDGTGFVKLLDFDGINNGFNPLGNFISDGTFLYGMTGQGGANNLGTIFKIKSDGSGYVKLLDFAGTTNGSKPWGSLISDSTFLYGMTYSGGVNDSGTVFKIMTNGSNYTKLLDFSGAANGSLPRSSLMTDGIFLYGMTSYGGINNDGTVFKIKMNGTSYTKLLDFASTTNGSLPLGNLISDGTFLYGMTYFGGTNDLGTVFKLAGAIGIEELVDNDKKFFVYPNPTSSSFTVKAYETDKHTVDLYDINGRHIFNKSVVGSVNIDTDGLDSGIYTLTIRNSSRTENKKLIISR